MSHNILCFFILLITVAYSNPGYSESIVDENELNNKVEFGFKSETIDEDYRKIKRNIIFMMIFLIFIIIVIYLSKSFLINKFSLDLNEDDEIKVISIKKLNSNLLVYVIEVDGERFIISANNASISISKLANKNSN